MNIRSIIHYGHGTWSVLMCAALLLLAGCQEDELVGTVPDKDMLNFRVGITDEWNHGNAGSTTDSTAVAEEEQPKGTTRISSVRAFSTTGAPDADSLYLHTLVANTIEGTSLGSGKAETRGTPIDDKENFHKSFGLFAYYAEDWSDELTPDYLYNIEVKQSSGGYWSPASRYYWPADDKSFFMWAYAPYDCKGLTVPASTGGQQVFTYTVPQKAQDQQDLLMAEPEKATGEPESGMLELKFRHVLTAVRFVTGDDIRPGSIRKITLRNMHGKGTYTREADEWDLTGEATKEFVCEFKAEKFDDTPDVQIHPDEATFMMLPQQLTADAEVEVVFKDEKGGAEYTLKAKLAEDKWPMSHTVTYRISTTSIYNESTLKVVWDDGNPGKNFTYLGGDGTFKVISYTEVKKEGESMVVPVAEPWTVTFIEDGNESSTPPTWLEGFTISGNGSTDRDNGENGSVTVLEKDPQVIDEDNLNRNEWRDNIDLSTQRGARNTANCYVINTPGSYKLPLVYGNAIKNGSANEKAYKPQVEGEDHVVLKHFVNHLGNAITHPYITENDGCTPEKAELLWQDANGLITSVELLTDTETDSEGKDLHFLKFTTGTGENFKQGNAVIAIKGKDKDGNEVVIWNWHIWVTGCDPESDYVAITSSAGSTTYEMLDCNLGWCQGVTKKYDSRTVQLRFTQDNNPDKMVIITLTQDEYILSTGNNTFYQWGRKDPFPGLLMTDVGEHETSPQEKEWFDINGTELPELDDPVHAERYTYIYPNEVSAQKHVVNNILNPVIFYSRQNEEGVEDKDNLYCNLWSATESGRFDDGIYRTKSVKTIYDPCPVGYKVPVTDMFRGLTDDGKRTWMPGMLGYEILCDNDVPVFYSATGYREYKNTEGDNPAKGRHTGYGYCWTSDSRSTHTSNTFRFTYPGANAIPPGVDISFYANFDIFHGFPVRPVRDK